MSEINLSSEVTSALDIVMNKVKPESVFIYGSRARDDFKEDSDYEVGVLFERDKKVGRAQLAQLHTVDGLNLYPFILEDLREYKMYTPFPKAVYLRELITGAHTVRGAEIIDRMEPPEIKLSDIMEEVMYALARSIGAVLSYRQGDQVTTSVQFAKSNLFGTRALVVLEKQQFPISYNQIYEAAQSLELDDDSKTTIEHAMAIRRGSSINPDFIYKNITYLNQVVYPRVKSELAKGDRVVLSGHPISW